MLVITREEAQARGLKRYYTGKPCKRGHYSERHLSGPCYACQKEDYYKKIAPREAAKNARKKIDRIEKARVETEAFCKSRNIKFVTRQDALKDGLPRYFDGVKCKHGHLSERFVNTCHCVECGKLRSKQYVQENPEKRKATLDRYATENYEKELIRRQKFVERKLAENPDYWKEQYQKYREKLLQDLDRYEQIKQKAREYASRPDVRERARRRIRFKTRTNPDFRDAVNIKTQLRRRRIRQATPDWLDKTLLVPFYAEAQRLKKETGVKYAVDHYYPLQGETICGLNVPWNLQVITWKENSEKHNRMPEDFYGANHTPPTWEPNKLIILEDNNEKIRYNFG